jgi:hypothetical protein
LSKKNNAQMRDLINRATDPKLAELTRIDSAKKLVGIFLQANASSDDVMQNVDWLSSGMSRLKGSGRRPPRYADIVLKDYTLQHLSELFRLMGERLETVSFLGSTPRERLAANKLINEHFLNDKESEVYESIRLFNLDELIKLIEDVSNGHDFLLGKQATQMFNHPHTAHLDVPVYMMGQMLRAIARRMSEIIEYTPPMP